LVAAVFTAWFALPLQADDGIEAAVNGTFRIAGDESSATCFLVQVKEQIVLVTAEHVFARMKGDQCKLILREKKDEGFARRELTLKIRNDKTALWQKHPQYDLAAMAVEIPTGVLVTPFAWSQLADEKAFEQKKVRLAQEVWIPCYPAQLEANPVGWPVLRRGSIASHPLSPLKQAPTFMVDFNTFAGDSGAPVLVHSPAASADKSEQSPLIVGVVLSMLRQTDKSQTPFEERIQHTPLGISNIANAALVREVVQKVVPQ
jgi:hypothetical protein